MAYEIASVSELRELFGAITPRAVTKEMTELDDPSIAFIERAPFLVLATTGADGSLDASPKGGEPGFVRVVDRSQLLIPDFPGNRRFDGVRNLVERPTIALLFVVPGVNETMRVNGRAVLTRDPEVLAHCATGGRLPWFVTRVTVEQAFSHCGKAFLRAGLWKPDRWPASDAVPSPSRGITELVAEGRSPAAARSAYEAAYGELY